jgi:hypothetical protein
MDKRGFVRSIIGTSLLSGLTPVHAKPKPSAGPVLLTISGQVTRPNRGRMDDALDQLMYKHGVMFQNARTFSYADLSAMPATTIRPTVEYDARPHVLSGPTVIQLLEVAGAPLNGTRSVSLRALDGYVVDLALADIRRLNLIVAMRIDGVPLPLGGLGPLWATCDADRIPELASKPLKERFAQCPWGLYSMHVG